MAHVKSSGYLMLTGRGSTRAYPEQGREKAAQDSTMTL